MGYRSKCNVDITIAKHKARVIAKGFNQIPGVDHITTLSLVIKLSTLRIMLFLTVSYDWNIRQVDIKYAFLNGDIKETMYIAQPEGF